MGEADFPRMEQLSGDAEFPFRVGIFPNVAVGAVSEDRRVFGSEVHADLVRPSRFDPAFQERVFSLHVRFQRSVMRNGGLPVLVDAHFRFVFRVFDAEEFFLYGRSGFRRSPRDDGRIGFFKPVALQRSEEAVERTFRLRDKDRAGGVPVYAVDERRTERERVVFSRQVIGHRFDERNLVALMVSRMDVEAGRLVYDEKVFVFEKHAFRREAEFRRWRSVRRRFSPMVARIGKRPAIGRFRAFPGV